MNNPSEIMYIAEVSANHLGSLDRARRIVEAAASAGATAVKFQTYTPETMTLDIPKFIVGKDHALWGGRRLYDLYREAATPWEWHHELFELARGLNLIPFSSPFDGSAVDFLETLDAPMYKIASLETGDHELIRKVAETGKPLIISTGATEWEEICEFVNVVESTGNEDLTLLVCTSSYPAEPKDSHINRITKLRNTFGCKVGLSDHTLGIGASLAAISLGATVIEKHLTINRSDGGADASFSMEPREFTTLVQEGNIAKASLGSENWSIQPSEVESRSLRRSLYIVANVAKGEFATTKNVRSIRPGGGLEPKYIDRIIGMTFIDDFEMGTPLDMGMVF